MPMPSRSFLAGLLTVALVAIGYLLGERAGGGPRVERVLAMTALSDGSFAVCTAPIEGNTEGFFMLDFETGDLSGGVLSPATGKFAASYKTNVLKDLGFKAGQAKNPHFLLVAGQAELRRVGSLQLAQSVLYVTDSATGSTVAYGIPWNQQAGAAVAPFVAELLPLDVARPRGGAAKAP